MAKGVIVKADNSLASNVVSLIAEKNSNIDNGILMNKINMILTKVPKLAQMPPDEISKAILKAMIPDNTLQDHNDIYFIPYGRVIDVSFSHNYLQKLAYRNGAAKLIETFLIFEGDRVEITESGISYSILPFRKDQDEFLGVMVRAKLRNNEIMHDFVSVEHIEKARKASKSGNNGPWKTWYFEMAKKTSLKHMFKSMDISPELSAAVSIDNEDTDFSKLKEVSAPSGADELENLMKTGSREVHDTEEYLQEMEISFKVKGDWIMIDAIESDLNSLETIKKQMNLIEKKDKPGMLFGKITELTSRLNSEGA